MVASVYRAGSPEFPDPLDTTGSLLHGGRFNAPGLSSVLYTSLDPFTACLEFLDASPDDAVDRLLLYVIPVRLEGVLDLRNPDAVAALVPVESPKTIIELDFALDDRRLPTAVAAAAAAVGADSVLAPSGAWHRYADDSPGIQLDAARLDPTRLQWIPPPDGLLQFPATATLESHHPGRSGKDPAAAGADLRRLGRTRLAVTILTGGNLVSSCPDGEPFKNLQRTYVNLE